MPMEFAQKIRVTKKFTIDMAHALYGYDGPCKNIHGHTYTLSVTLSGIPISDAQNAKNGMVIDFGDIKKLVRENIVSIFDHALVIYQHAPYSNTGFFDHEFEKVIKLPFQPTCENLLLHFLHILNEKCDHSTPIIAMRLDETPTSYSEWFKSDNM
jgi:6-pyruvoyltetrahydropterin/6-carboxytetrahydropterin synthase